MKSILLTFSLILLLALAYGSVESDVTMFAQTPASTVKPIVTAIIQDDELAATASHHLATNVSVTPRFIELTPEIIERANKIYTSALQHRTSSGFADIQIKESLIAEIIESKATADEFSRLTAENQRLYDAIQASTSN
jgi:hypothetical protein